MAICGIGGDPVLISLEANRPAMPPATNSRAATTKKPQKNWVLPTGMTHHASQDRPSRRMTRPKIANTAAAPPMAAPLARRVSLVETSALASSTSSRMSSEARSEISLTASAMAWAELWSSVAATEPLQDQRCHEAARERGGHLQLGLVLRLGLDARR